MQRTREEIIYHFHKFILGFIYHDIERCIEARANYVVALALLSYTEYIGGLISGHLGLKDKGIVQTNFEEALKYFPNEYKQVDSSIVIQYIDEDGQPILDKKGNPKQDKGIYRLFRCGMVHEYFIKGFLTTMVNNNPDGYTKEKRIGIETVLEDSSKRLIFYTNEYFRDFKSAVDKIYKLLIVEENKELLAGFNKSLDTISSRRIL